MQYVPHPGFDGDEEKDLDDEYEEEDGDDYE